ADFPAAAAQRFQFLVIEIVGRKAATGVQADAHRADDLPLVISEKGIEVGLRGGVGDEIAAIAIAPSDQAPRRPAEAGGARHADLERRLRGRFHAYGRLLRLGQGQAAKAQAAIDGFGGEYGFATASRTGVRRLMPRRRRAVRLVPPRLTEQL